MWSPIVAKQDQTRTDVGVPTGLFGSRLDGGDAAGGGLVGEVRVQDHLVERPTAEGEAVRAEGHEAHGEVLVQGAAQVQDRVRAGGAVVAHDHLAPEQPAQQPDEVLHLGGGDGVDAVGVLERADASAQPEHEPATGEALHGPGEARR